MKACLHTLKARTTLSKHTVEQDIVPVSNMSHSLSVFIVGNILEWSFIFYANCNIISVTYYLDCFHHEKHKTAKVFVCCIKTELLWFRRIHFKIMYRFILTCSKTFYWFQILYNLQVFNSNFREQVHLSEVSKTVEVSVKLMHEIIALSMKVRYILVNQIFS